MEYLGPVLSFLAGAAIATGNFLLANRVLKKHPGRYLPFSLLRQGIQVAYLAALFFWGDALPWNKWHLLLGGALGITLPMLFFTVKLLKTNASLTSETEEEEETHHG